MKPTKLTVARIKRMSSADLIEFLKKYSDGRCTSKRVQQELDKRVKALDYIKNNPGKDVLDVSTYLDIPLGEAAAMCQEFVKNRLVSPAEHKEKINGQ